MLYRKAAKAGCAEAQRALGYLYDKGLGLPRSYAKAYKWYARAALQADETACNNIGVLYHDGKGVRRSKKLAKKMVQTRRPRGQHPCIIQPRRSL